MLDGQDFIAQLPPFFPEQRGCSVKCLYVGRDFLQLLVLVVDALADMISELAQLSIVVRREEIEDFHSRELALLSHDVHGLINLIKAVVHPARLLALLPNKLLNDAQLHLLLTLGVPGSLRKLFRKLNSFTVYLEGQVDRLLF